MVEIYRASFIDYLTDPQRSGGNGWAVDAQDAHPYLFDRCLDILCSKLEFNITRVHDSHQHRSERRAPISGCLAYVCQHWAGHVLALKHFVTHIPAMENFLRLYFPFWLEVLIELDKLELASVMMRKVGAVGHCVGATTQRRPARPGQRTNGSPIRTPRCDYWVRMPPLPYSVHPPFHAMCRYLD